MTTMSPERVLEHAEKVRELYTAEHELAKLEAKIAAGHTNLTSFRDRLAAKVMGGAA